MRNWLSSIDLVPNTVVSIGWMWRKFVTLARSFEFLWRFKRVWKGGH